MANKAKDDARDFLQRIERYLIDGVRESEREQSIPEHVERIIEKAKHEGGQKHLHLPEAAFLNRWLPPAIRSALRDWNVANPKDALLAESFEGLRDVAAGTAARPVPFPFKKEMMVKPQEVYARWAGSADKAFAQPCPDFALRQPHPVVFEGKFFLKGSLDFAQRQLVEAVYETLFYLGVPAVKTAKREWDYDYACLVAYDGSREQTLVRAWQDLAALHNRFWDEANLYVMVIGTTQIGGMNFEAYEALFRKLGFSVYMSHRLLKHSNLKKSVYFNRDRSGRVWFAVYTKDMDAYKPLLWDVIAPPQKKDSKPGLRTVVPKAGLEKAAFRDLLKT